MSSNALLWPSQGTKPEERLDKYKYLKLPSQGIGGVGVLPVLPGSISVTFPPIADNTYQFYKFYQIKKNQVPTTQTNMPLVIIDTLGPGILQEASGFDIRVFDSAGVPLDYEVQSVDTVTGAIIVWVNLTTVKDSEFIQLTFGKPTATDGSTPNAVFDSSTYDLVYHMNLSGGIVADSTTNNNDGVVVGATDIAGKIGRALSFNGINNNVSPTSIITSLDKWSIVIWVIQSESGDGDFVFDFQTQRTILGTQFNDNFHIFNATGWNDTGISTLDKFHQIVIARNGGTMKVYVDSILTNTIDSTNLGGLLGIGADFPLNANMWPGIIDEIEILRDELSQDYITAQFNNQNNQNDFWHKTPLLTKDEENLLVDNIGRNIVAVQV